MPQTAYLCRATEWTSAEDDLQLYSHEECLADKKKQASNFRHIEEESNKYSASRITQAVGNKIVVVNPPYPPMSQKDLDHSFDLPYTRLPHPKYKGKRIPAYDMIKFSINIHRGMFRRLCILYHFRPSGKVYCQPKQRVYTERGKRSYSVTRFQGIFK